MNLIDWANKWGVPQEALEELTDTFWGGVTNSPPIEGDSEAAVQSRIRLEASRYGARLFRNNVGAGYIDNNFIRWGLGNDSKKMNDVFKSSDLIGIRPVVITKEMIGRVLGQFIAREVKPSGWTYSGTPREKAQLKFIELIVRLGGDAQFANGEGTIT
jgi:hypothetical protein